MIPKIIHQTWKNKTVPEEWARAVESCKKVSKQYKYMLWTDKTMYAFVKKYYSNLYDLYKSYKYDIQRCDAFRYLVLYKYGGIYLDMDIVCKKNLSSFLQYDLVLARSTNIKSSFTNSFYMTIPNHPFFKYCIDKLASNINNYKYFGKHLHVMYSTGPAFLNNMINSYGPIENMYILTEKEFAGDCTICNERICKGGEYFTHIHGSSWNELDTHIYNFLFCNKNEILIGLIICCLIIWIVRKNGKR